MDDRQDDLDGFADQVVARISDAVVASVQQIRANTNLSFSQILVITLLRREGPLRLGQIASNLGITSGSATPLIDGLEKRGLVERRADPHDRRAIRVALSSMAEEAVDLTRAGWTVIVSELLQRVRPETIDDFMNAVDQLGLLESSPEPVLRALEVPEHVSSRS